MHDASPCAARLPLTGRLLNLTLDQAPTALQRDSSHRHVLHASSHPLHVVGLCPRCHAGELLLHHWVIDPSRVPTNEMLQITAACAYGCSKPR